MIVLLRDWGRNGDVSLKQNGMGVVCHCVIRNSLLYSDNVRQSTVSMFISLLLND